MKISKERLNHLLKWKLYMLYLSCACTWNINLPLKNYFITFTTDKPMNDIRMILGNDTPCPQKGNENGLTYSPNIHHSVPMCPNVNITKVKQYDMSSYTTLYHIKIWLVYSTLDTRQ